MATPRWGVRVVRTSGMSVLSRRPGQPNYRARVTAERFDLVIVGGGNMGAALAGGLLANGIVAADRLAICETLGARREQLAEQFAGVYIGDDVPACRAAVLAVKPGDVADAAAVAAASGARRLLSIAAGVRIAAIEQAAASDDVAVVRAMPNTPALVGEGAAAISGGSAASDDDLTWAERILGGVGLVVRVPEELLDAVTGLSGSGPAYVFLVAESLIDAAVDAGLPQELAAALTIQLLVGSAKLLAERGDPAALRAMVTSPGGTTAAGLRVLDERGLRQAFVEAVRAATQRSRELSQAQ
jgi:pyrroline-5-carboxylate reductase